MVSSSRHWHSKLLCRTIPTRILQEERRTASSPSTADGFDAAGHPRFEEASIQPRYNSAAIKSPWVFGPHMETKASGRLDVYNPGEAGERLLKQCPKNSVGTASCDHSTPSAIAEGSDLQLPVKKTHLFSDGDAPLAAPSPLHTGTAEAIHTSQATGRSRASAPPQVTSHRTVQHHLGRRLLARTMGGRCVD